MRTASFRISRNTQIAYWAAPQESVRPAVVHSTNDEYAWNARCLQMDFTAARSAPPRTSGAAPAYYLDRSSVGGRACLNAPPTQNVQRCETHWLMPQLQRRKT